MPTGVGSDQMTSPAVGAADKKVSLSDTEKAWIRAHPTIRLGIDPEFAPFEYVAEDGTYSGITSDYVKLLNKRLSLNMQVAHGLTWKETVQKAKQGEIDVLPCVGKTEERKTFLHYSSPYIDFHRVIISRTDATFFNGPGDLWDKQVAVQANSSHAGFLKDKTKIQPLTYPFLQEALLAVADGKADAFVGNVTSAMYWIAKLNLANLKVAAPIPGGDESLHFAVRKEWPELVSIINKGLASISPEEKTDIQRRWVAFEYKPGIAPERVYRYLAAILVLGLLGAMGLAFWRGALKKEVGRRTEELRQELTERKKVERALLESEERFRSIYNATNDAILIHDLETGVILDVNQKTCEMFGMSRAELLRSNVGHFSSGVPPYTQEEAAVWVHKAALGEPQLFEWHAKEKSGRLFWVEVNMRRGTIGQEQRIIISARDISERKMAEEDFKRINEELLAVNRIIMACASTLNVAELLDKVMGQAISITGLEGGAICYLTPEETLQIAAHRATPVAPIEDLTPHAVQVGGCLCGECARDHKPLILTDRQAVLQYSARASTRGGDIRFHAAFPLITGGRCVGVLCVSSRTDTKPKEGSLQLLEIVSAQIAMAIDNACLYTESVRHAETLDDKVQERTAELDRAKVALLNLLEDISLSNAKLKELDQLKSMFIASMSHELRTPLNSVIGFSKVLANEWAGSVNDEQKKLLLTISRSGKHLLALINDVIDISKIESGKLDKHLEDFDLQELITEALDAVKKDLADKQLTLTTVQSLPLAMHSDRRRLLQCLLNLLSNAIKFTIAGGVGIEMKMEGSRVLISVTDTGIGIAAEDMPLLFGSFVRLESPLKASAPGTGLGLYLVKKLARETLGGDISVESTEGVGSRFTLAIPVRTNASAPNLVWGDDGAPVEGK